MSAAEDYPELPKVYDTVVHMLAEAVSRAGDAPALECQGNSLNYTEYARCVGGFAAELMNMGARGGRVALICGNSIHMAIATFAGHAAGAQVVPVNPIYTGRELGIVLADADAKAVVYDAAAALVEPIAAELGIVHRIMVGDGGQGDGRSLDAWRDDASARLPNELPTPESLATLQYTGGTTGLPKGVNITHRQLAVNISQREAAWPTRPGDERILCVMPLFHVFASSVCLHPAVYCRGTMVILPRFHPGMVLDAIESSRITRLPAGPTILHGLMGFDGFEDRDFSSLRSVYSGSAPLPEETLHKWQAITGCPVLEGFGQSEGGPVLTVNWEGAGIVPGSVGKPLPATRIEIVDVETGNKVLPAGEQGEVRAKGPQVMSGYRGRPQETAETLRGDWLYTGDIGELDQDGNLYIRDRKKDMAIVGGYNVYPREIDEVLYTHPDVAEAAAVGVNDAYRGEVIVAHVVLAAGSRANAEELIEHCGRNLAKYKVPGRINIVNEIPKTTVGKIDKAALREISAAEGG
ncbi:MAG: AMP-binding protein [Rhodospirillales bacterium]|jgi:long-chain acyl-CoA synthetase|nr:long-chain fatty acid--CoA ligase [Rhodospirillaceae bacterium]MDP6428193.1 AMP-binding protein [Rhodospirillales bacterium]MDP6642924.1 AMP-binding protein [Rhodospirillales bacterium]MDP6841471.1 AMP-binding protein [Rhodospirillales bacterium]